MKATSVESSGWSLLTLFRQWYPLALSRIVINSEGLLVTIFLVRMPHPLLTLAAFGGLVYPVMFLIESPTWMFLSTSTALSKTRRDFLTLLKFAQIFSLLLSLPMVIIVLSPYYAATLEVVLGAEGAIAEYSRAAFLIAVPWVVLTADRRVYQGVLIRAGYSKALLKGTILRLIGMLLFLACGLLSGTTGGAAWGAAAITLGLFLECLYVRWVYNAVELDQDWETSTKPALSNGAIIRYYAPLALDGFFLILRRPLGSAAMLRLPYATESLAIVGAVYSFIQCMIAIAISLLEVLVSYIEEPKRRALLWRFTKVIAVALAVSLLVLFLTPLENFLLETVLGLATKTLIPPSEILLLFSPIPVLLSFQKYFEALAMAAHQTRFIIEATLLSLLSFCLMILCVSSLSNASGAHIFAFSLTSGVLINVLYLRSRVVSHSPSQLP